jgi:outer membrane cobalamin receptor
LLSAEKQQTQMKKKFLGLCFLAVVPFLQAQETVELDEAVISDQLLLKFAETQTKTVLSDSLLDRNSASLTQLLNFNSSLYFKENGAGMVSSPSFRGTSASHTAVVWNGINVNSSFLGQSDFNVLNSRSVDQLVIKSGGGSVAYGSSAIGGSIHLNNELKFRKGFQNQFQANYGSFDSYGMNWKSTYSDENLSLNLNLGRNGSDNDFEIPEWNRKNLNGKFYHQFLDVAAGYKFNSKNTLKFYGNLSDSDRHFSLISANSIPTKYHDFNTKTMVEWESHLGKFQSNFKFVHLGEEFRYYPNTNSDLFEFGNGNTYWLKYDLGYQWKNLFFNLNLDASHAEVESSKIEYAKRQIGAASFQFKHQISSKFLYEASVRQEITDAYDAPFLYALGVKWNPVSFYQVRVNSSKNFRMPTFNDLYWPAGGNLNLNPETSYQYEFAQDFHYKNWNLQLIGYHNSIENYIQWIPQGSISVPENLGKVKIWGMESNLEFLKKFRQHQIQLKGSYAYTVSENDLTDKQLIYVPFHKATASAAYSWQGWRVYYQGMYNGEVFTDSGNTEDLEGYFLSNAGMDYGFGKHKNYRIGFQVLNLLDEEYQNLENRPMPRRNYNITINIKF